MTAVILMLNGRFQKQNQDFLKSLNDWTFGKIWQNLIILAGRTEFRPDQIKGRLATQQERVNDSKGVINLKTLDGNASYKSKIIDFNLFNNLSFEFKPFLETLFERSKFDKQNSRPWLITTPTQNSDGTYSFKQRDITKNDFHNIKSSLFNGHQVNFVGYFFDFFFGIIQFLI